MKSFASSMNSSTLSNHSGSAVVPANLLSSFRSNLGGSGGGSSSSSNDGTSSMGLVGVVSATGNRGTGLRSIIPHQGALCRLDISESFPTTSATASSSAASTSNSSSGTTSSSASAAAAVAATAVYAIDIGLEDGTTHELNFSEQDFDFVQKLFAILDTESRGAVDRATVKEFVTLRCPVFLRRDDDLRRVAATEAANNNHNPGKAPTTAHSKTTPRTCTDDAESPTFDEVWKSVVESSKTPEMRLTHEDLVHHVELGVESWMVFCRFIALAQYLEAKRRFSARHLQQTMRHRNSPRGSEVVVVDVPPPEPPAPLSREQLAKYERKSQTPLPLPELDLDHSLVAAHDSARRRASSFSSRSSSAQGTVKISLFGSPHVTHHYHPMSSSPSSDNVEFKVSYTKSYPGDGHHCTGGISDAPVVVRRSMDDMKWLNDTFTSHNVLGGTLCGRILPPFPGSNGKILSAQFQRADDTLLNSSIKNTTGGAIAAAAAGVEIIRDVAKSFWKSTSAQLPSAGQNSNGSSSSNHQHHNPHQKKKSKPANKSKAKSSPSWCLALPESYYNPNSPAGKARQIERYLNYLLEHPALSTSFPLNTILKSSQSGLEAAKQSLEECLRLSKEVKEQTPQLVDGKTIIPFWGMSGSQPGSLSWVRTAAQAAMALKVHGILETTGMQSASARLQHASLPNFDHPAGRNSDWVDEEQDDRQARSHKSSTTTPDAECLTASDRASSFEQGVVKVQSELQTEIRPHNDDDGYDLLPLPIPAPERRILSAGSRATNFSHSHHADASSVSSGGQGGSVDSRETRFHYGTSSLRRRFPVDDEDDARSAFLGDISVDEHIDKLREVIGSVDNTLSRCLASSGGIGRARRERLSLHLDIVRGFDSWKGLRGKFIGQRALLKGVSGIEQSNEVYEESDLALIDDVSWQTALAASAVHAAEDVRSAVRAARTAENAKAAASAAAMTAQSACDSTFPSIDEARAAQTRASIAQSHAFHAAVVEHEAKAVKRRATLALAHDVKCWNVHRKREMLQACIAHARTQHEATRRAVDAWSCLRDGFIGSSIIPPTQTRKAPSAAQGAFGHIPVFEAKKVSRKSARNAIAQNIASGPPDLLSADAFADFLDMSIPSAASLGTSNANSVRSFSRPGEASGSTDDNSFSCIDPSEAPPRGLQQSSEHEEVTATIYQDLGSNSGNGKPVIVAVDHHILAGSSNQQQVSPSVDMKSSHDHSDSKNDPEDEMLPFAEPVLPFVTAAPVEEVTMIRTPDELTSAEERKTGGASSCEDNEIMSASMQSLVDGLMSWGGQFEAEDALALPSGMAASIAFEERDALNAESAF